MTLEQILNLVAFVPIYWTVEEIEVLLNFSSFVAP